MVLSKENIINLDMLKRVILFIVGISIMAFGVSLSIKADIGVTPISCVPYIFSLYFPLTVGEFTILLHMMCMLTQMIILRRDYKLVQLVQFPAVLIFGYCIDITLRIISNLNPSNYVEQFVLCILSCLTLAFGIFILVNTKLTYLPIEGLIIVISKTFKKEFGKVKISLDSLMVIVGVISSFAFLGELKGIREGSFIAALIVGVSIRFYSQKLLFIKNSILKLSPSETPQNTEESDKYNNTLVITISREYGSGGHEIGRIIAKKLGLTFYDESLISLTAQKTGYTKEYIENNEQKLTNSLLYDLYEQNYAYVDENELPPKDALFLVQSKIIRDICKKESCVIVGRCANFILKDHPNCINIFIHANSEYRKNKINNEYKVDKPFTDIDLEKSDEQRANYCLHFTKKEWRDISNYHLAIDSSLYGTKKSAKKIIEFIKKV